MNDKPIYRRVLLKVSGEAMMGDQTFGIDPSVVDAIAGDIAAALDLGVEIAIVVGGGNIFRGVAVAASGGDRVTGDHMGMLATVMNCLALHGALQRRDVDAVVLSAIAMPQICETFTQRGAREHLQSGRVLLFAAGTGNPYFTTDSGAALRAAELQCDALLKATNVDGVYSADPKIDATATRFERLSHDDVLQMGLQIMDAAAIALARDNRIPIIIFSIHGRDGLLDVLKGRGRATIVSDQ
jgi:uridylate kinase